MKTHHPTTTRAIVVASIWAVSLVLRAFDLEAYSLLPFVLIIWGLGVLSRTPGSYRKPLTWKDGLRMVMNILIFIIIVAVFIKFPALQFASDGHFRWFVLIGLYLFLAIHLWRQWHKARQQERT